MSLILFFFFFFRISPLITFTITSLWDLILGHSANVEMGVPPAQAQESVELHGQTWLWLQVMVRTTRVKNSIL